MVPAPVVKNVIQDEDQVLEDQGDFKVNMSSVFRLENFRGDGSQSVESYLRRFDQYRACTGINDDQSLATLAWHLDGTARLWFENLQPQPDSVDALKAAMRAKFKKEKRVNMAVYTMRQELGESVEDFLYRLEKETFKQQITQDIQVQIALNGMDRAIGSAISTHAPKTLDDVKQLTLGMGSFKQEDVKVAQATIPSKLETTVDVLTAAVAQLAARLDDSVGKKSGPQQTTSSRECPGCGGRCFSTNSCRAMGKTCYKCKKLNHFGNKCKSSRQNNTQSGTHPQRYSGYPQ